MDRAPSLKPPQMGVSAPAHGKDRTPGSAVRRAIGIALWVIGFVILAGLTFIVHVHTAPWPFELGFTKTIQGSHPIPCPVPLQPHSWVEAGLFDISQLNNPIPSVIAAAVWLIGMLLLRLFRQALYYVVAVASVGGLFLLLTPLIARPSPTVQAGICVHDIYSYYSFPSGHVSHDVVSSGFLLYVTLSEPVRRWRYRWLCSSSCIAEQRISSQARASRSWWGWQGKRVSFSCVHEPIVARWIFKYICIYLIGLLIPIELLSFISLLSRNTQIGEVLLQGVGFGVPPAVATILAIWRFNVWRWRVPKTLRDLVENKRIVLSDGDAETSYLGLLEHYRDALASPKRYFLSGFLMIVICIPFAYAIVQTLSSGRPNNSVTRVTSPQIAPASL